MNYTVSKKMMFIVMCVFVVMINNVSAEGNELSTETVGAEVTVKPEKKFAAYSTPEEDVIVYGGDTDEASEESEIEVIEEEKLLSNNLDIDIEDSSENDEEIKDGQEGVEELDVVPETGDSSNLVLWGCVLAVAFVASVVLGIFLFKKK